jgi:hypothetical protein
MSSIRVRIKGRKGEIETEYANGQTTGFLKYIPDVLSEVIKVYNEIEEDE